jgi:hypothetical protein
MPAVRGDGMRGLAVFISDIRNCKYIKHSWLILILLLFIGSVEGTCSSGIAYDLDCVWGGL